MIKMSHLNVCRTFFLDRWHWHFVSAISERQASQYMSDLTTSTLTVETNNTDNMSHDDCSSGTTEKRNTDAMTPPSQSTKTGIDFGFDGNIHGSKNALKKRKFESSGSYGIEEGKENEIEFSSSVSFWWGRRMLKPDSVEA